MTVEADGHNVLLMSCVLYLIITIIQLQSQSCRNQMNGFDLIYTGSLCISKRILNNRGQQERTFVHFTVRDLCRNCPFRG